LIRQQFIVWISAIYYYFEQIFGVVAWIRTRGHSDMSNGLFQSRNMQTEPPGFISIRLYIKQEPLLVQHNIILFISIPVPWNKILSVAWLTFKATWDIINSLDLQSYLFDFPYKAIKLFKIILYFSFIQWTILVIRSIKFKSLWLNLLAVWAVDLFLCSKIRKVFLFTTELIP
jgi:hypothetical protein